MLQRKHAVPASTRCRCSFGREGELRSRHSPLRLPPQRESMELWDTQKLRDALHVLSDDPAVQEAARVSHLDNIINAAQVASSPERRKKGEKGGEQRRPFWAKLRTEIDDIITTTRDRAVAIAGASVARRLAEMAADGGDVPSEASSSPSAAADGGGDDVPSAANSSTSADHWAALVCEWCSAMEFFAESARALVLAESGPRDERPIPTIARRCRRALAVMERVGDAFDDLEAISNQAGDIPLALVSETFLPASALEHAEAGWVRYYWRTCE